MITSRKTQSFLSVLLLAVPLLCLTGCLKKKKTEKKVAQVGRGFDLSGSKKGSKKYDQNLEAFILDDQDEDGVKAVALNGQQVAWKEQSTKAFEPVFFDFDRYVIRPDQQEAVQLDAEQAKTVVAEGKLLKVEGHSDKYLGEGVSETYNIALSQRRAHTMATALADAGVERSALKPVGFGASKPAVDAPGKIEANRRAEIVVLGA